MTESARVAGDELRYSRDSTAEAVSTLAAGFAAALLSRRRTSVSPAYKQMGRESAGYTLAYRVVYRPWAASSGYVSFIVELIPRPVIAPILVFVALDIVCQAFVATPQRHAPAVAFSFFPIIARLVQIELSNPDYVPVDRFQTLIAASGPRLPDCLFTVALGNGFVLTAMLWGAFVAKLIDRQLRLHRSICWCARGLTFFGVIHSALPEGNMYLPWSLPNAAQRIPYQFTSAYLVLAAILVVLSFTKESREAAPEICSALVLRQRHLGRNLEAIRFQSHELAWMVGENPHRADIQSARI